MTKARLPSRALVLSATVAMALMLAAFVPSADAYVYWVAGVPGSYGEAIARANLDGSHVESQWLTGVNTGGYPATSVAVDAAHVYWLWDSYADQPGTGTLTYTDHIGRANLDGSSVNADFVSFADPHGGGGQLALHGQYLYFPTYGDTSSQDGFGAVGRVGVDGSALDLNFVPAQDTAANGPLAVEAPYIYFYEGNQIGRANLADGSGVNPSFIGGTGGKPTNSMAADAAHLYWTLAGTACTENKIPGDVARANLDGSDMDKTFIDTGCSGGDWIAVDGAHVYWGYETGEIGRANIDGTGVNQAFIQHAGIRGGIAVDSLGASGPGAPACIVPNLRGLKLGAARRALARGHCTLGAVKHRKGRGKRRGRVLAQSPRAGSRHAAGAGVAIVLGR